MKDSWASRLYGKACVNTQKVRLGIGRECEEQRREALFVEQRWGFRTTDRSVWRTVLLQAQRGKQITGWTETFHALLRFCSWSWFNFLPCLFQCKSIRQRQNSAFKLNAQDIIHSSVLCHFKDFPSHGNRSHISVI